MLPGSARLTRSADFTAVFRSGRRAGRPLLVLHLLPGGGSPDVRPARVGFVTSKSVGPAVVRNRVRRRLRHLLNDRLAVLPVGALLVVRATPAAAVADSAALGADLDRALRRLGLTAGAAA